MHLRIEIFHFNAMEYRNIIINIYKLKKFEARKQVQLHRLHI